MSTASKVFTSFLVNSTWLGSKILLPLMIVISFGDQLLRTLFSFHMGESPNLTITLTSLVSSLILLWVIAEHKLTEALNVLVYPKQITPHFVIGECKKDLPFNLVAVGTITISTLIMQYQNGLWDDISSRRLTALLIVSVLGIVAAIYLLISKIKIALHKQDPRALELLFSDSRLHNLILKFNAKLTLDEADELAQLIYQSKQFEQSNIKRMGRFVLHSILFALFIELLETIWSAL